MDVERDWFGRDWKSLRTQLVKLCVLHSDTLLRQVRSGEDPLVEQFMEAVREEICNRIPLDRLGLWQNGLPLLIQPEKLKNELVRDREALSGRKEGNPRPVQPRQALGRKLNQFFEMNRREHLAGELGVSSNQIKTWERLDKVSRKVAREHNTSRRCSEEHFAELASYVKANHPTDKNLPRKAKTVKGYFYRFSDDCVENIEDREDTMDKLSLQEAKDLLQGVGMAELSRCLQQLTPPEIEIIDVSFQLGMSKVVYRSLDDYLQNRGLALDEFTKQQDKVMDKLRLCLESGLAAAHGGLE